VNARTAILGLVAIVLGIAIGHVLLRVPQSEAPSPPEPTSEPSVTGPAGPLPFAPEGPVPCRRLPGGQLLLLYPAASASASPLSPASSEFETNAINVVAPNSPGTQKAWVYIVISEAEPEVAVTIPEGPGPDQAPAPGDTESAGSG
jgi:hypothetical protein